MSIQVRSCTVHAEVVFHSMLFEHSAQFAELMVFERQVQATINMFGLFGQTSLTYDDGQGE